MVKFFSIPGVILLLALASPATGQQLANDIARAVAAVPQHTHKAVELSSYPPNEVSELKLVAFTSIRGYQRLVSSQDATRCSFHPSCSRFAAIAFEQEGFLKGLLLSGDRLTRCTGFPDQFKLYQLDPQRAVFIDRIDQYVDLSTDDETDTQ